MTSLNSFFDNIYVLYIDNDEVVKITPKLKKYNIQVEMFKGVNGYTSPHYNLYANSFSQKNNPDAKFLNQGSYGHIMSFINILKDARTKKYKKILILEPDVYFCEGFNEKCVKYLNSPYSMLYLGASQNKYYTETTWDYIDTKCAKDMAKGIYSAYNTLGTFAIALDSCVFNDCIDVLLKLDAPTDVSFIKLHKKHNAQVAYPNLICCDLTHSKTSLSKNQLEFMEKLRWNLKYDFVDELVLKTETNSWYEIELLINSNLPIFSINFYDNSRRSVFPEITNTTSNHYFINKTNNPELANYANRHSKAGSGSSLTNKKCVFYIWAKSNTTIIVLNNIFLDNYGLKKIDKNLVKTRLRGDLARKGADTVCKYYLATVFNPAAV
jgi:GR25 family glycosyltransferase involved in LPS biosynthesis